MAQSPNTTTKTADLFNEQLDEFLSCYMAADNQAEKDKFRDKIVEQIFPYIKRIAHGIGRRSTDPVEDLVQMGNIGLIKAIEKFNPLMGSSFKTYSTYFITGEMRHYLRDKTAMIKAPRQMYELYYRVNQVVQELTNKLERTPTDLEIADALEMPVKDIEQAQSIERRRTPISLDQFMVNDNGNETVYLEKLVDDKYYEFTENRENRILVEKAVEDLKDELKDVVVMTYYKDMSQTQIADVLGISQMQVSRRLRKALDILNSDLKGNEFNL